ncbi:glycosyltransferase family 2 protein [Sphingomonas sp. BIUV-7]|uniref:Glycosyltransferase family 2 protein n=1 Tax=Sphingomonas natans TaxID=3063330 RepID=A0ABT8YEA1_9SPHN|nr:glycosyltransferase family 2 protein [Sphingomonas sp. BIUV-7]MDO6416659.1 glycosyltransferase family 2 protein [Sphingomonas sp. BIUV-7]
MNAPLRLPTRPFAPVELRPLALAVIIPTLNECDNVAPLLAALDRALAGREWEAIFVDDGSTDGTQGEIETLARHRRDIRLIRRHGRRGLSTAIIEGMMATTAPVVAAIDADMQHDEAILPRLHDAVLAGADIAVGTRYANGGSTGEWDKSRVRKSEIATRLAAAITQTRVSDPMSGFFVVRREAVLAAVPHMSGVGFKVLLDLLASSPQPLAVAEVPYTFRSRQAGASKLDSMVALEYLLLLVDKITHGAVPARMILFLAVGAVGLIVNLAALDMLLNGAGFTFRAAQTAAVALSILFNFALNNWLTYNDRRLRGLAWLRGLATFTLVCGIGAIAQVGISEMVYDERRIWWIGGLAGAAVGAVWNYAASSFLTWRRA